MASKDWRCPKCGHVCGDLHYDTVTDKIECECVWCHYTWTEPPLDARPQEQEEARHAKPADQADV